MSVVPAPWNPAHPIPGGSRIDVLPAVGGWATTVSVAATTAGHVQTIPVTARLTDEELDAVLAAFSARQPFYFADWAAAIGRADGTLPAEEAAGALSSLLDAFVTVDMLAAQRRHPAIRSAARRLRRWLVDPLASRRLIEQAYVRLLDALRKRERPRRPTGADQFSTPNADVIAALAPPARLRVSTLDAPGAP